MRDSHTLAQEFVLLASDAATHGWRKPRSSYLQTYAAGAVLIELLNEEVIRIGDKGKLEIVRTDCDGDEAARMMLDKLQQSKPKTMKKWMRAMYTRRNERLRLFQAVVKPLVRNGELDEFHHRVLLLFPAIRYAPSAAAKDRIIQRIRAELLENGTVSGQTALLTMMLEVGHLLKGYFSEYERSELKARLKRLQEEQGEEWKQIRQIRKAIEEINATAATTASMSVG